MSGKPTLYRPLGLSLTPKTGRFSSVALLVILALLNVALRGVVGRITVRRRLMLIVVDSCG